MNDDYQDGWKDCRTYAGEDTTRSAEYRAGFRACVKAYHESVQGWSSVPVRAPVREENAED
jgi:hypothetical protein